MRHGVPARDPAHGSDALVVECTKPIHQFLSQTPTFRAIQKDAEDDGRVHILLGARLDVPRSKNGFFQSPERPRCGFDSVVYISVVLEPAV